MDLDKKDLAYHYYEGIKIVNELIDEYFDLLATNHLVNANTCDQICVIKAKSIEINLLKKAGYSFDSDELFHTCQGIFWASLHLASILHNYAIDHQLITKPNDEPSLVNKQIDELKELINLLKYLEAHIGIIHDYEQYFKDLAIPTPINQKEEKPTDQSIKSQNPNSNVPPTPPINDKANQAVNLNQHDQPNPVRLQAKRIQQWLLDHFPSKEEYLDLAFQLKTISDKLNQIEQLIKNKKKPN